MHIVSLAFLLLAVQRPEIPAQQPPVIVVTGTSEVLAVPDEAIIRLGIVRQATAAEAAQQQANSVAQEILKAISAAGVPSKDVQTARLVLSPVYNSRNAEQRIVSYNAANTVSIRLDNLGIVGNVVDAGLKAGANQLEGVQFRLKNELPSREQALREAVQEARGKAQAMADALHVNLAEVLEATEGGVSVVPRVQPLLATASQAVVSTPVSPGEIEVRANVTIRYRISPKP
ncbi:MAG TPA: SIMPL domain-containing protein [Terriglobia bacterium]|jgi:hypothetical protein